MPPTDNKRPRKRVKRKAKPAAPRDAIYQRPKPKVRKTVVRSEIAADGGVSSEKVKRFKKTKTYKRELAAAKPARVTDVSSTSGYDVQRAVQFRRNARKAIYRATQGKPFDGYHAQGAINLGYKGYKGRPLKQGINDTFFVRKRRKFLNDIDIAVQPERGAYLDHYDKRTQEAEQAQMMQAGTHAAGLKVLEATAVPIHAIAGTVRYGSPARGVREKTLFSDVLKKAGAPKIVQGPGGFVLDVFGDPTTYITFGAASLARKEALRAAEAAARKAEKAGMTLAGQTTVARAAAKRAAAQAKPGKGVTVSFAGKQAPGVTKATAAAGRAIKTTAAKAPAPVKKAGAGVRKVAGEFRPTLTPAGADAERYVTARQAARSSRSSTHRHIAQAEARSRGIKDKVGEADHARILDAIEKRQIGKLPEELRQPAIVLRSSYRHQNRLRKRAGIAEGTVTKRRKVVVPAVTADVEASRQRLNDAMREVKAQEKLHQESLAGFGVARGRAQVLSRNVGGTTAETRAQALTVPDTVNQFAGGGHGVRQAADALQAGARNVAKARENVRRLAAEHEGVVTAARQQRVAKGRAIKQQAARKDEALEYVPHAQERQLHEGLGIVERSEEVPQFSGTLRRPGSSKARQDRRPISAQNPERAEAGREALSTDIPLLDLNYARGTAKSVAAGGLEQALAATGRELKPKIVKATKKLANGKTKTLQRREYPEPEIRPGEAIYHLGYSGAKSPLMLREVQKDAWTKGEIPTSGKFVILDRKTVDAARQYGRPTQAQSASGQAFDRFTRGFKVAATATPGFHLRNLVGDTQLAYLSQPGHKLPLNLHAAYKATKGLNNQRRLAENLTHDVNANAKTIKVAGKPMTIEDFLALAHEHGIPQSGYLTREIADLGGQAVREGAGKTGRVRGAGRKVGRAIGQNRVVKAVTQDRENLVRMSTFKHGLDDGLTPAQAADLSMQTHIDYADLTELERRYGRRLMPFYTFSARALPFQAKRLVQRPGKFANIEKAREEIGGTDVSAYTEWTQRQIPFLIGGKAITDGLPVTLLNEIPAGTSPKEYANEVGQYVASMLNPALRVPIEAYSGRSLTFRNEIQPQNRPLVSAPSWVEHMPGAMKRKLGVTPNYIDRRTGKKTWGWYGRSDYWARVFLIGPANIANQLATEGTNRIGQDSKAKALAGLTGVRVTPPDAESAEINRLYDKLDKLEVRQSALNQQGIKAANATPEYERVTDAMKLLEQRIYKLSQKRGDKVLPSRGAPPRPRVTSPNVGGGGLGGGLGGGGLGAGGLK